MEPKPFLETRYKGSAATRAAGDHWIGGKPRQQNAICPSCRIPLLLLWDINCRDRRFSSGVFGSTERLPLFFCWGCVSDLSYQVVSSQTLEFFPSSLRDGPNYLYPRYPKQFKRRPLALSATTPKIIRDILAKWNPRKDAIGESISRNEKRILSRFFGHSVKALCFSMFHHQLGGIPLCIHWASEVFRCPNLACPGRNKRYPPEKAGRAMKFLAGVLNDPAGGLPMVERLTVATKKDCNFFVTVQFHICDRCFTITACNRCD